VGRDDGRRLGGEAGRRHHLERPWRPCASGGRREHRRDGQGARGPTHADLRNLPRPSDSRPRLWRQDLQAEVRPPGREPAREGPPYGARVHILAEPRVRSRPEVSGGHGIRTHAREPERRDVRGDRAHRAADSERAVPSGGTPGTARQHVPVLGVRGYDTRPEEGLGAALWFGRPLPPAPLDRGVRRTFLRFPASPETSGGSDDRRRSPPGRQGRITTGGRG